ncbi:MAG: class B sortase [Candidatus Choladocola sp.]|nr:class B sortase [Candidatus Choladocola sp.]
MENDNRRNEQNRRPGGSPYQNRNDRYQNGNSQYRGGGGPYQNGPYNGGPYNGNGGGRKKKKKGMSFGEVMSILLMLIALCVFIFSGVVLYGYYKEYKKGSDEYDNLQSSYSSGTDQTEDLDAMEDDTALQSVSGREMSTVYENGVQVTLPTMTNPIDFADLQNVNSDVVGWLKIRALDISYPLVQGEDNDYYLHRTFEKTDNFAGCLFVNCDNKSDFTDQNTIIYGHNMKNGSMFGKLKNFQEEETFEKSKYFWIFTPDLIYQYRIFSACVVNKTGLTYQTSYTNSEFQSLINYVYPNSVVKNSDVQVSESDRIVTLSTCTGDDSTRFVVMGKLAQIYAAK